MVFGNYKWTEFDEDFLSKNVESVAIVDAERQVCKPKTLPTAWIFLINVETRCLIYIYKNIPLYVYYYMFDVC